MEELEKAELEEKEVDSLELKKSEFKEACKQLSSILQTSAEAKGGSGRSGQILE